MFRVYSLSETAQVELKCGRVLALAGGSGILTTTSSVDGRLVLMPWEVHGLVAAWYFTRYPSAGAYTRPLSGST